MTPTRALAERIAGTQYADIPAPARTVAKQALLDFIGVTMAGIDEPLARMLRDQVNEEGGHPQAQLIGTDERASTVQAALVNGSAGHAHDYDDVHTAMTGHPTVPVAPAVLALAERLGRSGEEAIAAFCAGVDTECILGHYAPRG
jgi:2-methylcitrate dehydratase PrpD